VTVVVSEADTGPVRTMKEPLVLLPGMMCLGRLFNEQFAALSRICPVLVAPMHGHSSIDGLAQAFLRVAPARFALAGLSMGGITAMEIVRRAPERVSRLALLDTNPLAEQPEAARNRDAQIARARVGELEEVMSDELIPKYGISHTRSAAITGLCLDMARALGPAVFEEQSRAIRSRRDQRDTLATVTVPTLVLCGENDTLCPVERHETMRELIPSAILEIIRGAGHLPVLEQPEPTNRALARWLT